MRALARAWDRYVFSYAGSALGFRACSRLISACSSDENALAERLHTPREHAKFPRRAFERAKHILR